jgi:uncharacterized HAD superfamily protein
MEKTDILKAASNAYYLNASMIKFLLVENLALKTLLHEKGLITPDEYKKYQEHAGAILAMKEEAQMLEYFKKVLEKANSQETSEDSSEAATHKC